MLTAREIMDQAVTLNSGQRIAVQCASYNEMEALRTNLYKLRAMMLKKHRQLAYTLWVSRKIEGDNYFVIVTKETEIKNAVIINPDGSTEPMVRKDVSTMTGETEDQRIMRLMREDGKTEEEIAEYFAEKGEQDFDAAASKIEEAQGLVNQDDELELDVSKKRQ